MGNLNFLANSRAWLDDNIFTINVADVIFFWIKQSTIDSLTDSQSPKSSAFIINLFTNLKFNLLVGYENCFFFK